MASLIYLASPYSDPNPSVRELRFEMARLATANLLRQGLAVYSPIVYGKDLEKIIGTDYLSWKVMNDAMLESASSVVVLKLDGWEKSLGVTYEIDKAKQLNLPIAYLPAPEINR